MRHSTTYTRLLWLLLAIIVVGMALLIYVLNWQAQQTLMDNTRPSLFNTGPAVPTAIAQTQTAKAAPLSTP